MVSIFEVHSLVQSLLKTSFYYLFLNPRLTTSHLNIGVHNIVMLESVAYTLSQQSKLLRQFFYKKLPKYQTKTCYNPKQNERVCPLTTKPDIFLQICTHTRTITINSDMCPAMPSHAIQIAPMY